MAVDPKQFWEAKLLAWEQGRYGGSDRPRGLLEWIANRSSMSLRFRVAITPELLRPYLANKHVVELGCGSGIMAGKLIDARYGDNPKVRFLVSSIADMPPVSADLIVSLGLFDWLTDDEITGVFRKSGSADFLHAIAERRPGVQQWLHRSYVQLAYGYRTDSYRPRYFKCDHVGRLATVAINRPIYVFRSWRLSFGALVSSLPIGKES